jgi:hypothetical protein
MQRIATIGILVLAGLFAFPAVARADHRGPRWGFNFGFGWQGGHVGAGFGGCRPLPRPRHVHVHTRRPCYEKVWVPPVYETVVTGYWRCGTPIYRTVQVRCGYYKSVLLGHRCGDCGVSCD